MADISPALKRAMDRAVALCREHADTVQVVVTTYEADAGTETYAAGAGNWMARRGSVDAWLRANNARDLADVINKDREE